MRSQPVRRQHYLRATNGILKLPLNEDLTHILQEHIISCDNLIVCNTFPLHSYETASKISFVASL